MDPLLRLTIRLAQWLRNPPSRRHVRVMLVTLALAAAVVAVERWGGWPDWLRVDQGPRIVRGH